MDNKDLITRFAEDCFRFEALHQEIDSLIADEVNEVLIYEYEDLANQAAEIVLKLSANGNNLGLNFYRYYVERLEYIIDYFRALLDYEETPLAEDEQDELDDEPTAETHFEGFPAGCVFPSPPPFVFKNWELQFPPMTKDEENAAPLDRKTKQDLEEYKGWVELSKNERKRVLDTLAVYVGLPSAIHEFVCAPKRLQVNDFLHEVKRHFNLLSGFKNFAEPVSIRYHEDVLRGRIWKVINGVENFRDSQMYNALVKLYPTYKEEEAGAVKEDDSEDEQPDEVDNENDVQAAESDEAGAVKEDDSEDEQSDEVDNENDTQAAESDEAADGTAAGAPSSEFLLPPDVEFETGIASKRWNKLSSEERAKVRDMFAMWHEMKKITRRHGRGGDFAKAVEELDDAEWYFGRAKKCIERGLPTNLMRYERSLRERINRAIGAIPGFRDSEEFKKLIELYPTYKEIEQ